MTQADAASKDFMTPPSSAREIYGSLSAKHAAGLRDAGQLVVRVHEGLSEFLRIGMKLPEIDRFVHEFLREHGATSCFHRYRVPGSPPFPSYACLSVNECVVHGTAGYYREPLRAGDVLKVDIGVKLRGWIGDAAWTYVFGEPSDEVARLTACGKESLVRGIEVLRPGNVLLDWARAIHPFVEEECGFKMIRGLGGHGYGRRLHQPPYISNVLPRHPTEWPDGHTRIAAGMTFALEPMIAVGSNTVTSHPSGWPLMVDDGSQSVHYEHDVIITTDGCEVLTAGLERVRDVIER